MPRFEAVFLDRDGVLNSHLPGAYVRTPSELIVPAGVAQAIRRLNDAGVATAVISNQQGVGKGLMTRDDLGVVQQALEDALKAEAGADIDDWRYCTDLASVPSTRRKPEPGMLFEAAEALGIDIARIAFIGDSPTDIAAGRSAGVGATILVLSGATKSYDEETFRPAPDRVFPTLGSAVDWVLGEA